MQPHVLIFPGAGTDSSHASIVAIHDAILAEFDQASVRRVDFPYRLAGRRAPDRAPVLIQSVVAQVEQFAKEENVKVSDLYIGGRSMGGRMCSMAVAQGLGVRGLFCVSYPLHPPGKPEKLRTEHFVDMNVPTIFVSGTRDSFGTRAEFEIHTPEIGGNAAGASFEQVWIEGGDHSLTKHSQSAALEVANWIRRTSDKTI